MPLSRSALWAADWQAARAAFEAELAIEETAAAFDGLARARWWLSDISGAIEAWEQAYTAYRRAGRDEAAAQVAVLLGHEHAEGLGNDAVANGWLARARHLLGRAGLAEIALGQIEEGMIRFDEGMAASAAGEAADLRTLGDLYCAANLAAEITLDVSRSGSGPGW